MSINKWMDKENVVLHTHTHTHTHTHIMEYYLGLGNSATCDNVNEPWGHYAK